jgi:O-antigen/teichoic acid export membrane protein
VGYLKKTIRGISWMGGFRAVTRIVAFAKTAILARLLLPAQFGLFGIASLMLELLEVLTETGVNIVLVQEKKDVDSYINTTWIVSIIRGILIALFIVLATPFISIFFKSPDSAPLLYLMAGVPLIRGFINPSEVKFQKNLEFNKEFWFRFAVFGLDTLTAVWLAYVTHSPAALIWGLIVGAVSEVVLSFVFTRPRPKLIFERKKLGYIFSKGKWMTGAGIFNYLFQHGDDVIVGRLLGQAPLGLYQVAYRISILPITEVSDTIGKVTFPVYVGISKDIGRLKKAYLKMLLGISLLVIPFGILLYLFAKQATLIVLGEKWIEVVPVLKILAIFGSLKAVINSCYPLLLGLGRQKQVMLITLAGILGLGISVVPLTLKYGLVGTAISTIIGLVVSAPFAVLFTRKALNNV